MMHVLSLLLLKELGLGDDLFPLFGLVGKYRRRDGIIFAVRRYRYVLGRDICHEEENLSGNIREISLSKVLYCLSLG